jgi:hypothetical protein
MESGLADSGGCTGSELLGAGAKRRGTLPVIEVRQKPTRHRLRPTNQYKQRRPDQASLSFLKEDHPVAVEESIESCFRGA